MIVRDIASGATLESHNAFVCEQWQKHPEKYVPIDKEDTKEPPTPPPETKSKKEAAK